MKSKILLINDPPIDHIIIDSISADFNVIIVPDGIEAMNQIRMLTNVGLLIFDVDMEHMDVFKFLKELNSEQRAENIDKIIFTNHEELNEEIARSESRTIHCMRKPINIRSLKVRILFQIQMIRFQRLLDERTDESSLTLDTILDQAPIGIVLSYGDQPSLDVENDPAIINRMFEKLTGRTRKELVTLGWAKITHPDDRKKDVHKFNDLLSGKIKRYSMEKRFIRPDGSLVWLDITVAPLKLNNNSKYKHICLAQDITERKNAEGHLCESERSKSMLLSNLPGMAYRCTYDRQWTMQFVSAGCFELTGYISESLLNNKVLSFNEIIAPEYQEFLWQEWGRILKNRLPFRFEYEIITAEGARKWVLEIGQGVFDRQGNVEALEGIIIDISDRRKQELKLKYLSEHDPITGLYNRTYFENMLSISSNTEIETNNAVLLLNIKKINSISLTYGYCFCEQIMTTLAGKLLSITKDNIKLFQISFERFALYVSGFNNDMELTSLCETIFDLMSNLQIINAIGCGIGIFKISDFDDDPETILKNVSIAAESIDRNSLFSFCFFDEKLKEKALRKTQIEKELMAVFDGSSDSIYLVYQPFVSAKTGNIIGFEALARMKSESIGLVSPRDFIPLAEELQLIVPLGLKILGMACEFKKELETVGYEDVNISVNVSTIQVLNSNFVKNVIDTIEEADTSPKNLCLEVTESVFADNFDLINQKLGQLQENGISIFIDDFGTGYSSLAREREWNVDCVKIDKTFIDKLEFIDLEDAITGDIILMAHKLGHLALAEGVETERQKQYLLDGGCDFMQGFLFSEPVDPSSAIELLKKANSKGKS